MDDSGVTTDSSNTDTVLDEINATMSRYRLLGSVLLFSLFFYILLGVFLLRGPAEVLFLPGFVIASMLTFVGLFFLALADLRRAYLRDIKVLQRLSPPNPTITERYAVIELDNTYIFTLRKNPDGLFFVSFSNSEISLTSKIHVPQTFWKWSSALHIEGLRVHDRHGTFSVPTPEGEIRSGEGILLLIPLRGTSYVLHVPEFSRKQLLAVVEYASLITSHKDSLE
jgi:hypothetical protein